MVLGDAAGTARTHPPQPFDRSAGTLGNLTALITLDVSFNQLKTLPASLGNLNSLTNLYTRGNPLRSPLREIAEDGMSY